MFPIGNLSRFCDYLGKYGQFWRIELLGCTNFGSPLRRVRQAQTQDCVNLRHTKDDKQGSEGYMQL